MTVFRCPIILHSSNTMSTSAGNTGTTNLAPGFGGTATVGAKFYSAGWLSRLRAYVSVNSSAGPSTLSVYSNGVATALTVTIAAGVTGWVEINLDIAIVPGNFYTLVNDRTASISGTLTMTTIIVDELLVVPCSKIASSSSNVTFSAASTTNYIKFPGLLGIGSTTLGNDYEVIVPVALTLQKLQINVSANTRTTAVVLEAIKNGSGTGVLITVPGSGTKTGFFEDVTNSVSYSPGDKLGFKVVTGTGTGSFTINFIQAQCYTSSGDSVVLFAGAEAASLSTAQTRYMGLGTRHVLNVTEAAAQILIRAGGSFDNMYVNVNANAALNGTVYASRLNGSTSSITFTVPASTTGTHSDTTNSTSVVAGDLFSVQASRASGSSGVFTTPNFSIQLNITSEADPSPPSGFQSAWARNNNSILGASND